MNVRANFADRAPNPMAVRSACVNTYCPIHIQCIQLRRDQGHPFNGGCAMKQPNPNIGRAFLLIPRDSLLIFE